MQRVATVEDVRLWYKQIWHREPRKDEVDFHVSRQTPFDRLIRFLVENSTDKEILWHKPFIETITITADFLDKKYETLTGRKHFGMDLVVRPMHGRAIMPIGQGLVTDVGFDTGDKNRSPFGNFVIIQHNKQYRSRYAHLKSANLLPGWFVPNDSKKMLADNTGWSTGDHLHVELHEKTLFGWKTIDPKTKVDFR